MKSLPTSKRLYLRYNPNNLPTLAAALRGGGFFLASPSGFWPFRRANSVRQPRATRKGDNHVISLFRQSIGDVPVQQPEVHASHHRRGNRQRVQARGSAIEGRFTPSKRPLWIATRGHPQSWSVMSDQRPTTANVIASVSYGVAIVCVAGIIGFVFTVVAVNSFMNCNQIENIFNPETNQWVQRQCDCWIIPSKPLSQ